MITRVDKILILSKTTKYSLQNGFSEIALKMGNDDASLSEKSCDLQSFNLIPTSPMVRRKGAHISTFPNRLRSGYEISSR